jgi:hypothetical protein
MTLHGVVGKLLEHDAVAGSSVVGVGTPLGGKVRWNRDFFVWSMVFGIVLQVCRAVPGQHVPLFNAVPQQHARFQCFGQCGTKLHAGLFKPLISDQFAKLVMLNKICFV